MAKAPTKTKAATDGGTTENDGTGEQSGGIRPRITDPNGNGDGSDDSVDDNEPEDNSDGDDTSENEDAKLDEANKNVSAMSANGDGVTGVTNDGVTNASSDGATGAGAGSTAGDAKSPEPGTPDKDAVNTQEGPTPMDKHGDTTGTDSPGLNGTDPTGPKSMVEAAASTMHPAGSGFAAKSMASVNETVIEKLGEFSTKDAKPSATSNIHDDLGIARADVVQLSDAIGKEFGIVIYASEAQNWLLVRDITNLVARKLAKQG